MPNWAGIIAASILTAFIAAPLGADQPAPAAAPATQPSSDATPVPVKTGKERLSSKASDEQRVDNCKVPKELRGTTARPDSCEDRAHPIPTN